MQCTFYHAQNDEFVSNDATLGAEKKSVCGDTRTESLTCLLEPVNLG